MEEEKKNSKLGALVGNNIREIIKEANKEGVKKDDIVTILYATHQYVLIYESKDE